MTSLYLRILMICSLLLSGCDDGGTGTVLDSATIDQRGDVSDRAVADIPGQAGIDLSDDEPDGEELEDMDIVEETVPELSLYQQVENVLTRSCSFNSCHGGTGPGKAALNFLSMIESSGSITGSLNHVPSCQYAPMMRVQPGDPENSWLFVKITGAYHEDGSIVFEPDPEWDTGLEPDDTGAFPASTCPLVEEGEVSFGLFMPSFEASGPVPLPEGDIDLIREWILVGAPGPE